MVEKKEIITDKREKASKLEIQNTEVNLNKQEENPGIGYEIVIGSEKSELI